MEHATDQLQAPDELGADSLDAIARSLDRIGTATFFGLGIFPMPGIKLLIGLWGRKGLAALPEHALPLSARRSLRQLRAVVDLYLFLSIGPALVVLLLLANRELSPAVPVVVLLAGVAALHVAYDRSAVTFGGLSEVLGARWLDRHWRSARRWNLGAAGAAVVLCSFVLGSAVHGPALVGVEPATGTSLMAAVHTETRGPWGAAVVGALAIIELGTLLNVAATYSATRDHVRELRRDPP